MHLASKKWSTFLYCTQHSATCNYKLSISILMIMMMTVIASLIMAKRWQITWNSNLAQGGTPSFSSGPNTIKMTISIIDAIKGIPAGSWELKIHQVHQGLPQEDFISVPFCSLLKNMYLHPRSLEEKVGRWPSVSKHCSFYLGCCSFLIGMNVLF